MFVGELKPFQLKARDRMIERKLICLAFDLGVGKTPTAIAAVEELIDDGEIGGGIIVCSKSLKGQWRDQIHTFTGGLANVLVVDGTGPKRMQQYIQYASGGIEYLILNIEQIVNDWQTVQRLPRDFIILDECQTIGGFRARKSKVMKRFQAPYKWGLSGQPINNRAEEIFSVLQWIDPTVLGDWEVFDKTFIRRNRRGKVTRLVNGEILQRALSDVVIRVSRDDVKDEMPERVEERVMTDFDVEGARLYRQIARELLEDLEQAAPGSFDAFSFYTGTETSSNKMQGRIASKITCLRLLCDHPELLRISAKHYDGGIDGSIRSGSAYASELVERGLLNRVTAAPKLAATVEEIKLILEADDGNKVVIFSFFKDMLNLLQQATGFTKSVLFHGSMTRRQREASKEQFTKDPHTRIFLSSDAGGEGLDLPMANYLINYDLPWSAGNWRQRNGRIDRISSKFPTITLLSMVVAESVEEWQYDVVLRPKQQIGQAIMDGKGWTSKGVLALDVQSLTKFLREHAV